MSIFLFTRRHVHVPKIILWRMSFFAFRQGGGNASSVQSYFIFLHLRAWMYFFLFFINSVVVDFNMITCWKKYSYNTYVWNKKYPSNKIQSLARVEKRKYTLKKKRIKNWHVQELNPGLKQFQKDFYQTKCTELTQCTYNQFRFFSHLTSLMAQQRSDSELNCPRRSQAFRSKRHQRWSASAKSVSRDKLFGKYYFNETDTVLLIAKIEQNPMVELAEPFPVMYQRPTLG